MLKLEKITKDYVSGELVVHALKGVSFEFRKSEFVSVLGPSGCGKTTLLNIMGGLDKYTSGDLIINGVSTKDYSSRDWDDFRNHSVGFIFQSYNLIMHQSVLANVELALTLSGVSKAERRERAKKALIDVGLENEIGKMPNQLSGGQMQRVAIARAIVNDPDIILADEPTGALDTETSIQVLDILKGISKDRLVIMVTHNPDLAQKYSTRIIKMEDGLKVGDSNPISEQDNVQAESETPVVKENAEGEKSKKRKKKSSMSLLTAFSLSLKNLFTKKARTILTAIAGSIGIIGIALIMSVSSGFQGYIDTIQRDTLSSSAITVSRQSINYMEALTSLMGGTTRRGKKYPSGDLIYPNNVMQDLVEKYIGSSKTVELDKFKAYLEKNIDNDKIHGVKYSYELPMLFAGNSAIIEVTDGLSHGTYRELYPYDSSRIMLGDIADETVTTALMTMFGNMNPFSKTMIKFENGKAVNNWSLIKKQYDLLEGSFPEDGKKDQMLLVVDEYNSIGDSVMFALGLRSEGLLLHAMFDNLIKSGYFDVAFEEYKDMVEAYSAQYSAIDKGEEYATWAEYFSANESKKNLFIKFVIYQMTGIKYNLDEANEPITFGHVLGTSYKIMPLFEKYGFDEDGKLYELSQADMTKKYNGTTSANVVNVNITGVVRLKKGLTSGCLSEGLVYQNELTDYLIGLENQYVTENITPVYSGIISDANLTEEEREAELNRVFEILKTKPEDTITAKKINTFFKVNDLTKPVSISIYASNFENKDYIVDFINGYNKLHKSEEIQYNDYMGVLFSSVSKIVNAITYVLIAFVSISLVVSSIMIGIITYISVLERTKEIGILRSIGASKRNVGTVFNAEAIMVGFAGGLLGIVITIIANFPITAILKKLTGVSILVRLPWLGGIALIAISVLLTMIAGFIPSRIASKRDPVEALRSAG